MASAMDSRLAYARLSAGRYGKPPTHSYQRLQQLLHHVLGHDRDTRAAGFPAINAVAMPNDLWIGFRLVAHRTAKASALESRHDMVLPV